MSKIAKMDRVIADKLLRCIPRIKGERRVAYKCGQCGKIFGRQFIPFGLGMGATYKACICYCTQHFNNLHAKEVIVRTP